MDLSETSKVLKQTEKAILEEIIAVCEKLNLRYYLVGGTLIGAIRHQGFIPWDDDIDIGMLREDYEEFLEKAPALLPKHLFVQTFRSDYEFLQCFAKVRNSNTTFIEKPVACRKINHGVFVDVFPLDYYPEDPKYKKKYEFLKKLYYRRVLTRMCFDKKPSLKNKIGNVLICILFPSWRAAIKKQEKLFRSVPKSGLLTKTGGYKNEVVPAEWYGKGTTVSFEGLKVNAPEQYDKLLTKIYGNYMTLPPLEEQQGHHYATILDLENSYTKYTNK